MAIEDALNAILAERKLSPQERNLLLLLVQRCDTAHWAHITQRALTEATGMSRSTVQRLLQDLERAGYLKRGTEENDPAYQPFPYNVRPGVDKEAKRHRLILSVEHVLVLQADVRAREAELTLLAQEAEARRDRARQRDYIAQIDARNDVLDRLADYFKHNSRPAR